MDIKNCYIVYTFNKKEWKYEYRFLVNFIDSQKLRMEKSANKVMGRLHFARVEEFSYSPVEGYRRPLEITEDGNERFITLFQQLQIHPLEIDLLENYFQLKYV